MFFYEKGNERNCSMQDATFGRKEVRGALKENEDVTLHRLV